MLIEADHIDLGKFEDIKAFSKGEKFALKYYNSVPRIVIEKLTRRLVISHWFHEIYISEKYDLFNDSPRYFQLLLFVILSPLFRLAKPFSRVEYAHAMNSRDKIIPMSAIRMYLPVEASHISYRDEVGLISTRSPFITVPNPKAASPPMVGYLDLSPRFPLYGGFYTSFELSYRIPFSNILTSRGSSHDLKIPIFQLFNDVPVRNFEFQVSFPEFAYNIDPLFPFGGSQLELKMDKSFLDLYGRPTLYFQAKNLVREHIHDFTVRIYYCFEAMGHYIFKIGDL